MPDPCSLQLAVARATLWVGGGGGLQWAAGGNGRGGGMLAAGSQGMCIRAQDHLQ